MWLPWELQATDLFFILFIAHNNAKNALNALSPITISKTLERPVLPMLKHMNALSNNAKMLERPVLQMLKCSNVVSYQC